MHLRVKKLILDNLRIPLDSYHHPTDREATHSFPQAVFVFFENLSPSQKGGGEETMLSVHKIS